MTTKHRSHVWKMVQVKIDGMHCANCEVLIERRFKKISGDRDELEKCGQQGRGLQNIHVRGKAHVVDLLRALGVPTEAAEADAEGIEHYVSETTLKAFAHFLKSRG